MASSSYSPRQHDYEMEQRQRYDSESTTVSFQPQSSYSQNAFRPSNVSEGKRFPEAIKDGAVKGMKSIQTGAVKGVQAANSVWNDFREFLNRGNVVDLAVGIVMGNAFTAIVNSFVKDLITPILTMGSYSNLAELHLNLKCPDGTLNGVVRVNGSDVPCKRFGMTFNTVAQATSAGAVTWNYGLFFQTTINFFVISAIIFLMVKTYAATFRRPKPKKTKPCEFCTEDIPLKATRCPKCTSEVDIPPEADSDETGAPLINRLNKGVKKVINPVLGKGSSSNS